MRVIHHCIQFNVSEQIHRIKQNLNLIFFAHFFISSSFIFVFIWLEAGKFYIINHLLKYKSSECTYGKIRKYGIKHRTWCVYVELHDRVPLSAHHSQSKHSHPTSTTNVAGVWKLRLAVHQFICSVDGQTEGKCNSWSDFMWQSVGRGKLLKQQEEVCAPSSVHRTNCFSSLESVDGAVSLNTFTELTWNRIRRTRF